MRKKSKVTVPKKKDRRPSFVWVEVEKDTRPTLQDIELAINKKLAIHRTELFRDTQTVVIVTQREGGRYPQTKGKE
jgi:hypothetical protein